MWTRPLVHWANEVNCSVLCLMQLFLQNPPLLTISRIKNKLQWSVKRPKIELNGAAHRRWMFPNICLATMNLLNWILLPNAWKWTTYTTTCSTPSPNWTPFIGRAALNFISCRCETLFLKPYRPLNLAVVTYQQHWKFYFSAAVAHDVNMKKTLNKLKWDSQILAENNGLIEL